MSQFIQKQSSGGGGDPTIGNPIINANPWEVLFADGSGDLAQNSESVNNQDGEFYFNPETYNTNTKFAPGINRAILQASKVTGLNDLILDVSGITVPPFLLYIEVGSTGTPDEFTYIEGSGSYGPISMGTPHTTPNGVVIDFTSSTGHTTGDSWSYNILGDKTGIQQGIVTENEFYGYRSNAQNGNQESFVLNGFNLETGDIFIEQKISNKANGTNVSVKLDAQGTVELNSSGSGLDVSTYNVSSTIQTISTTDGTSTSGIQIISSDITNTVTDGVDTTQFLQSATGFKMTGLPAYDDDAAAGTAGLSAGDMYQTTGSGAAPLNVAGIMMIKQ